MKQLFAGGLQNMAKFQNSEKSLEYIFGGVSGGKVADLYLKNDSITDFPRKVWNIPNLQIYKWTKLQILITFVQISFVQIKVLLCIKYLVQI